MGKSLVIPDNMPQPKDIYLDQIQILKSILKIKSDTTTDFTKPASSSASKQILNSVKVFGKQSKPAEESKIVDLTQSPSSSNVKRVSNKGKTTLYNSVSELSDPTPAKPGTMLEKLKKAAPYNIFFTTVIKAPETTKQPNGITFTGETHFSLAKIAPISSSLLILYSIFTHYTNTKKKSLKKNFVFDIYTY